MEIDTLYFIHHSHTDIGFTHDQEVVLDLHHQFIDRAIELCEQTADYPDGSALRWTCECTWPLIGWLRKRGDRQIERFLKLERSGRIEVAGLFAILSQCLSHEGLWRQLYPIRNLRAEYGMNIRSAMACDINGQHGGLVDALTDVGIGNFAMAINEVFGRAAFGDSRPSGFHWESAASNRLLVWNGLHYNSNQYFGIPDDYDRAVRELPRFLRWLEQRRYPLSFCMLQATHNTYTDNGPPDLRLADFVRRWNGEGRSPRMEITTLSGFFECLRQEPSERMLVHKGEWADFWNFGSMSTAYETQLNRNTQRRLVEAEWLSSYRWLDGAFSRHNELAEGWEQALAFDEHTWGANVSIHSPWSVFARGQLNQKLGFAYRARAKAQLVRLEAADCLARSIAAPAGRYVLIVNSLPWARWERLAIPESWLEGYTCAVPQLVEDENEIRPLIVNEVTDTMSRVQNMDRDDLGEQQGMASSQSLVSVPVKVPAMGYVLCDAEFLRVSAPHPSRSVKLARAENHFYSIELDPERGGIASLFDKVQSCEWVDRGHSHALGGYAYEEIAGAHPDQPFGGRGAVCPEPDWSRFMGYKGWNRDWEPRRRGCERVVEQTCQKMPGAWRLHQVCIAPGLKRLVYEVMIYDEKPWIDVNVTLDKLWNESPEACYLVFPFDLPGAVPRYEAVGSVVEVCADQLQGSNQDFPTVQGWIDWSVEKRGITVCTPDAPIALFGGFHFGRMHDGPRLETPSTFLSMVMNNYWSVNYASAQHGPVTFSYRLCPHLKFDSVWSSQRAREAALPVWGHPVNSPSGSRPSSGSLFMLDHPAVDVLTCKPTEDGNGMLIRFRNTSSREAKAMLSIPGVWVRECWRCDGVEKPRYRELICENQVVELVLPPYATQTYRFNSNSMREE